MTNEAAQLSSRQRRPLSPLTTSHSDSRKGANRAVCYTSKYLLQMETALARLAWRGNDEDATEGAFSQLDLIFWQARKYFRKTRRGLTPQSVAFFFLLSEGSQVCQGPWLYSATATLCRAPRGRCASEPPEMRIWICSFEENISSN